jgi:hypothetical protein
MKRFLTLTLVLLTFGAFAQLCPTPSGNSIIIKPTYSVGSSIANETNTILCYNNTSSTKITALQFKVTYDTVAFTNPLVSLTLTDTSNHYLQYYVGLF